MDEITNKIHNIELVLDEIKQFPQTYKTILKDKASNGTCQTIIRRKLNKMIKIGMVQKMSIPGTRFGKALFFTDDKTYNILVEGDRAGSNVYCFYIFKRLNKWYIELTEYWMLRYGCWEKCIDKKRLFDGNILKWI
jgi:hypothetical protein